MRDIEHRDAAAIELPQNIEKPLRFLFVESGIRFVENEETRLLQEHASKLDKLLLADAKPAQGHMHIEPQAEPVQEIAATFLHGADRDEPSPQRLPIDEQVRQNGALREQAQFLVDNADAVLPCDDRGTDDDRDTVELDLAGVRANDAREHFHQRRLARAVFPDDGMNVTATHDEIHAVDGDDPSVALAEVANGDERGVGHFGSERIVPQLSRTPSL